MSWSKLKKQFKQLVAPSLVKRIDFHTTGYRGFTGDDDGRAWITVDGEEITNMAMSYNSWWSSVEDGERSVFSQEALGRAMFAYLHNSIDEILGHDNQLIRALGMLDRRLGKRRLRSMDVRDEPPLLKLLYLLRCQAEGVVIDQDLTEQESDLKTSVRNKNLIRKRYRPEQLKQHHRQAVQADQILKNAGADNLREIARSPRNVDRDRLRTEEGRVLLDSLSGHSESQNRLDIQELILHVDTVSELLITPQIALGVIGLSDDSTTWLRRPVDWRPETKNQQKQFASLARHLYADYSIPQFLDQAWLGDMKEAREWFRIIGAGQNIRHAAGLPIKFTKKMAHFFLQAPDDYSIGAALRWSQIRSLGGDRRLCDSVAATRLTSDFIDDDFWFTFIQFLIDNPMLDQRHVGPIIDYIWNRKFEPVIEYAEPDVPAERPPIQPGFSMKGRHVDALLVEVDRWHGELGEDINRPRLHWSKSPLETFEFVEGTVGDQRTWMIRELLSTTGLIAEGKRMSHCVASYDRSCIQGKCSIWTMELRDSQGMQSRLTIELGRPNYRVMQARGKCNRLPDDQENAVLARWELTLRDKARLLVSAGNHDA